MKNVHGFARIEPIFALSVEQTCECIFSSESV